jgi:nitrogen fixation protein FixH
VKPGSLWPAVIAGALALHVVASLVVVIIATSDPSYAVEEDYYQKALHWDDKRAQDRSNESLGWSIDFSVDPPAQPGDRPMLEMRLHDGVASALNGAVVSVEAFHNARSGDIVRIQLKPAGDGVYRAPFPGDRNGRWELRFTIERGNDRFTHSETRHLFVEGNR